LVGDGLAVFVLVLVDIVFECVPDVFDVVVVVFDVVVVVLAGAVVIVFAGAVFVLFAVLFAGVSPPQAIPSAVRPKSAESAIAFFMLKTFSCLLQRLI
jgi:hypothetical protein